MADEKLYQAILTQAVGDRVRVLHGWIPERAADVGATVEVLPDRGLWLVEKVYSDVPILDVVLKETQRQRRAGLPSLRDTAKDKKARDNAQQS